MYEGRNGGENKQKEKGIGDWGLGWILAFLGVHGKGQHGVWLWEDIGVLGRREEVLPLRGRSYCCDTPGMGNRSDTPYLYPAQ